jgi:hypothetical protein
MTDCRSAILHAVMCGTGSGYRSLFRVNPLCSAVSAVHPVASAGNQCGFLAGVGEAHFQAQHRR